MARNRIELIDGELTREDISSRVPSRTSFGNSTSMLKSTTPSPGLYGSGKALTVTMRSSGGVTGTDLRFAASTSAWKG